ncbi:MAG: response regulator [Gemmatimonadales bacterium]
MDAGPPTTLEIPGTTLLVVGDDPSFRRALRRLLEQERISVVEADDGERAIYVIEHDEPQVLDAVLTDVAMQTVSGPELIAVLREYLPGLPIVAMSGWDPVPPRLPPMPILNKPFELEELIETLRPLVLTPDAIRRRARQMRADAAESRALARRQQEIAREHHARTGELMNAFMQLRERMKRRP